VGDGLEVRVEDGFRRVEGLAVAVGAGGRGVEALREEVLVFRGGVALVLEDEYLAGEEGGAEDLKVGVYIMSKESSAMGCCIECGLLPMRSSLMLTPCETMLGRK
jgi:hypothetical protein